MNQITGKHFVLAGAIVISCFVNGCKQTPKKSPEMHDYYVAVYVWPSCHDDPMGRKNLWHE